MSNIHIGSGPSPSQAEAKATEFVSLGSRLVRFGQALQEGSTTVGELTRLASACGISFRLRVVADSDGRSDE